MSRRKKNNTRIPDFEIDSLARALLPAIQQYFATEEGQREFAEWKASQLNKKSKLNNSIEPQRNAADTSKA